MLDGVKRRWHALEDRSPIVAVIAAVHARYGELNGGYLANAITLSAFLSLFPLLLVAVAVLGFFSVGDPDVTGEVLDTLGLTRDDGAGEAVTEAIATARESRKMASVIGVVGLLWSGLGLVAALQYAYDSVWQVKGRGIKDKAVGLLWLVGSGLLFALSFGLTTAVQFLPGFLAPVQIVLAIGISFGLFLWASKVLPNRAVEWRALVPGALFAAVGFEVLKLVGGVYVPKAVSSSSALYGSLGVVFALLAWLLFFGRLIVYSAALNVVLWERTHGTVTVELEVPDIPGRPELEGTRDGEVVRAQ